MACTAACWSVMQDVNRPKEDSGFFDKQQYLRKLHELQKERNELVDHYESKISELQNLMNDLKSENTRLRRLLPGEMSELPPFNDIAIQTDKVNIELSNFNGDLDETSSSSSSESSSECGDRKSPPYNIGECIRPVQPITVCIPAEIQQKNIALERECGQLRKRLDDVISEVNTLKCEKLLQNEEDLSAREEIEKLTTFLLSEENTSWVYLAQEQSESLLPFSWELSTKALPLAPYLMPTKVVNSKFDQIVPLPTMCVAALRGFTFKLYISRKTDYELNEPVESVEFFIRVIRQGSSTHQPRKFFLMVMHQSNPVRTYDAEMPQDLFTTGMRRPVLLMKVKWLYFTPSAGWMVAMA